MKIRKKTKKIALILSGTILLYTLVGFFLLPMIAKNVVTSRLSKTLNRDVTIGKIAINPYTLTAEIDDLSVKEKNKNTFFSVQKILANLSLSSLFTFTFVASELSMDGLFVNIVRNEDTSFNFSDLLNIETKDEKLSKNLEDKEPLGFILKIINITHGEIIFKDHVAKVSHSLKDLSLSMPFLSTKRKNRYKKAGMDINFVLNQAKFDIHVESTPFAEDHAIEADIKTSDIDVIHYLPYLPVPENILLKSLDLNLDLKADYHRKSSNNSLKLKGRITASNADVKGSLEEEIIKFPELTIDILKSDIFENQLNISKILVKNPELNLNRDKDGQLSLLNYIPQNKGNEKEMGKEADTHKKIFVFNLADFELKDGAVFFKDVSNEKAFKTRLFPLNIQVKKVEAAETIKGEYRLEFETEKSEKLVSKGRFQSYPAQIDGSLGLSNILFNKYAPYYKHLINFDIKEGLLDLSSDFTLSQKDDKVDLKAELNEMLIQVLSILDQPSKEEIINIPEFKINGLTIDLGNKKIDTGSIFTQNGKVLLKRMKNGQVNLLQSFMPAKKEFGSKSGRSEIITGSPEAEGSPWAITLKSFETTGFNLNFNDLSNKEPVRIDLSDIAIKAADLKIPGKKRGRIAAQINWNKEGKIRIKGSMVPSTLYTRLDIDLEKIDIKSLQPYFTDDIKILVTSGDINTKGKLALDMEGGNPKMNLNFAGEASLTNFISLDKQTTTDFFKCNSLYFSGLDVSVFPVNVNVKDISLTDFYSRIIVSDKGEINLKTIFKNDASKNQGTTPESNLSQKSVEQPSMSRQIRIESVTLQGGNISFSDYFTQPNFTANMKEIAGSVTGLSSDEKSRAKLHLQGIHGQSSPLDIVGKINPLAQKKFVDINISYKDIELMNFTPYSSRYLGYKIAKGKLLLDLEYKIDGNRLKSENRIQFDNLELGEKVDSEQATSLPVGLAISLLKDSDGRINLDVPVSGDLDDPEFKIGTVVLKMFTNLILKVVTSPFSIIGSMFGGGEELAFVDFEYGETKIEASNYEKIDKLVQILQKKPSVNLEIQGGYDKLRDSEALRISEFKKLIKAVKLKKMIASGSDVSTIEDVVVAAKDMELYIPAAYDQARFPKPKDEAGKAKKLGVEEKKKLLITNINIGKDDLRLLATKRSQVIKAYLLKGDKIAKERIFLIEPSESDGSNAERESRVKFLLK